MAYLTATKAKGHLYFKIVESYRVDGKVRHHTLYNIGPMSKLMELLPENIRNLKTDSALTAESEQDNEQPKIDVGPVRCRVHGPGFLLWSVAEWLEVIPLMDSIFPSGTANSIKRSISLLLSAIHRACKPGSMSQFADWLSSTSLPDYLKLDPSVFTAQHLWEQMDDITVEQIKQFETAFFRRILDQFPEVQDRMKCLSSDFTNYYTYISNQKYRCTIAQLGHSKEGRSGQKIFCVAVVLSPLLGIPIATMVYEGNHNDKTALKDFYDDLRERLKDMVDLKDMTFVFDGGGVSEEALGNMPGHFITRGSMKSSPELYDIPLDDYETIRVDAREIKAYRTKASQYGKDRTCVITLSDDLKAGQTEELDKQLRKLDCEIKSLNERLANPRSTTDKRETAIRQTVDGLLLPAFHMADFMDVQYESITMKDPVLTKIFQKEFSKDQRKRKKSGTDAAKMEPFETEIQGLRIKSLNDIPDTKVVKSVSLSVNESKKQSMINKYYGKHLLITDHDDWTTCQIHTTYRDQQFIERFFRDTKDTDHFSVRPSYHWTDQKIRVHVMICLGLALCRVAAYLMDRDQSYHISCPRLMEVLTPVQECLVLMTVNGSKAAPRKTICELRGETKTAWDVALKLGEYMRLNPIKKKE